MLGVERTARELMMPMGKRWLLAVLFSFAVNAIVSKACPAGWKGFGNSCYLVVLPTIDIRAMSWEDARTNCLGYGGDLVSITNSSEVDFIYSQTKTKGNYRFWIGLFRNKTTGDPKEGWIWSDGNNFTNPGQWHYLEPNNYKNNEKCAEVFASSKKWNDNDCSKQFASICERKKGLPDPTTPTSGTLPPTKDPPPSCDVGWEAYGRSCYKFVMVLRRWNEAKKACRDTGGHLVKIDDAKEQNYLAYRARSVSKNFWIGLNDLEVAGRWVWEFHSKDVVTFKNWQSGEPNGLGKEQCVEMYGGSQAGFWNDMSCSGLKPYICEKVEGKNACPENWIQYNDTCYQFNLGTSQRMTWAASKNACNSTGGYSSLVTIRNQDEQNFITKQVQAFSKSEVWIGLSDIDTETVFKWSDDSRLSTTNFQIWANGKPTENKEDKDCVLMISVRTDGAWSVQSCSLRRNFICMKHRDLVFCNQPLGMENGNIRDLQITASSSRSRLNGPERSRFRHNSSWCPAKAVAKKEFLQIDLGSFYDIRAIVVEGNVTSLSLKYGKDGQRYQEYSTTLRPPATVSPLTLSLVKARFVRIYPLTWSGYPCLRLELIGCAAQVPKTTECTGQNWEKGPGKLCYQINKSYRTWADARSTCLDQGGDLLSISTVEENNYIKNRIKLLSGITSLWISLNDRDYNDMFYWSNGAATGLSDWGSGDPSRPEYDKSNLVSCTEMGGYYGRWNDISCSSRRPFICMKGELLLERSLMRGNGGQTGVWMSSAKYYWPLDERVKDVILGTLPGKIHGTVKQASGVKNISNTAFQFSGSGSFISVEDVANQSCLTFPDACKNGVTISFMASFDNNVANWQKRVNILDSVGDETKSVGLAVYVENKQLWFLVSKTYIVVKTSLPIVGDKTWRHYVMEWNESGIYIYVNAKPVKLNKPGRTSKTFASLGNYQRKFLIGIQNSQGASGQLNLAMVAFWDTILTSDDVTAIYKAEFGKCPIGWIEFGMSCYQFNRDSKNQYAAKTQCQFVGGDLVNIDSNVEQSFVAMKLSTNSWIGAHDEYSEGVFKRTNYEIIKYSNWNRWEPNDYNRAEDCTEILSGNLGGLWNDLSCYNSKPYICEKTKEISVKPVNVSTFNIPKFERVCQYSRATIGCPTGLVIKITSAFWGRTRREPCGYISITNCGTDGVVTTTNNLKKHCDNTGTCDIHASEAESYLTNPCPGIKKYLEINYTCVSEKEIKKCGSGWKMSRDNKACYRLYNNRINWNDASAFCQSNNANLVSITTSDEQLMATSLMERSWYPNVWIGLNDLNTKGVYKWSDNSTVSWTNWYVGQPDERRYDKSCISMSLVRGKRGWMYWRDQNCGSRFAFICKKSIGSQQNPTTKPAVSADICPNGWIHSNLPYCYKVIKRKYTWLGAKHYCRVLSSGQTDLASINNANENEFVRKLSNDSIWIGLETRGVFRGHVWSDNKPVAYTNWAIGQPASYNGLEACVYLNPDTGYWSDMDCYSYMNAFVCQRLKSKNPVTTPSPTSYPTPGSSLCKQGWTLFNGMCYYAGNDSSSDIKTWHDAEETCKSMNGHLTSVTSVAEKSFLLYLIKTKRTLYFWIGLNDLGSESNYKWSDGTGYGSYLNWNTGEPNDHKRQEDCVQIFKNSGLWNDQHCSRTMSYICKSYNTSYHPSVTISPPRPGKDGYCPPGWIVNGHWCYEFHTDPSEYRTWRSAREACEKGRNSSALGELVSIGDEFEEAFLTIQIKGAKRPLWIGMNSFHGYSTFYWSDNSPAKYYKWNTREPRYGWSMCVEIVPYRWAAGRWNVVSCYRTNGYICKKAASRTPIVTTPVYTPTPTGPPSFTCPKEYKVYDESCYKFVNTPKAFDDARKICNGDNGELMSIDSQFKQAYLIYLLERFVGNVWIGLLHEPYSTFKFTDYSSPKYTYWLSGQPNRQLGDRSCTQANMTGSNFGGWDDVDCAQKNSFVCQIYNGEPKITIPINATCPKGWRQYDKYCYRHFAQWKSWSEAQYACSSLGSNLVSIHDDQEQDFLIFFYQDKHPFGIWTGLNDRYRERGYNWVDKSGLNYVNWAAYEPNDHQGRENCVDMQSRSGLWNDLPCSVRRPYMCKQNLVCSSILPIKPSMITVTESSNATSFGANQAIIQDNNHLAWCTNNTSGTAKIKIDLERLVRITKISIQGLNTRNPQFVKSFRIDYEEDEYWRPYMLSGFQRNLLGNRDGINVVTTTLQRSINLDGISITPVTWQGEQICMKIRLYGCDYVCQYGLIKSPQRLADGLITVKSAKYPDHGPKQVSQLGNAWCAKTNEKGQYVQVNFDKVNLVSKIRTFGDRKENYVKSYSIQISADGDTWTDYQEHGTVRIFKGNNDAQHAMVHILGNSIESSYIRILPLTWNKNICMRIALLGCQANCGEALLEKAQDNPDIKFLSSDENSKPEYALFNSGKAWCTSKLPLKEQYLQIDLGKRYRMTKLVTQGSPLSYGKLRQVSSFTLQFVKGSKPIWKNYVTKDRKQKKIFVMNKLNSSKPTTSLFSAKGFIIRQIKIFPYTFSGTEICMRVEIYGCIEGVEIIPTTEPTKQKIVNVSVRFTSLEWNNKLSDKESDEFVQARDKIEKAVTSVYKDSEYFRSVKVLKLSKGSVIAVMQMVFNPKFSENINVTQPLEEAVKTGKVGSLDVDKESFDNADVSPQARTGDKSSGLSGGAVAGIVITVLFFVFFAVGGGILFYRRRKRKQLFAPQHFDNPISYSSKAYDMDE